MAEYIKPGIYIAEHDKSSYITEGPTTITGIVGTSLKGPANEIVLMTNYSDYVATFGQDSGYLDFFARFFFKYGGNKLLVVRATDEYNFAGITNSVNSVYELTAASVASSDLDLAIQYVSGATTTYWPKSGLVRLDYNGSTEYMIYRELDNTVGAIQLEGCLRGVNSTTPITISPWGKDVWVDDSADRWVSATPHGLVNGQKIQFESTTGGVSISTDYWVINRTSYNFQITAIEGSTTVFALTTDSATNTVYKQPVPTKYIRLVAPVVCAEVLSGQGTTTVVMDGTEHGQFHADNSVLFYNATPASDETELMEIEISSVGTFDEALLTQTVTLATASPAAANGTWVAQVQDPYYGGLSRSTPSKYVNYDAWAEAKVDENGYIVKGAGITDPEEAPIFMNIYAHTCGAWANDDVRVSVYTYSSWNSTTDIPYFKNRVDKFPESSDELLIVVESVTSGEIEESWLVSLLPTKVDFWGKTMFITDVINENSAWIRVFVNPDYIPALGSSYNTPTSITYLPNSFERYFLAGGTNGSEAMTSLGIYTIPQVREFKIIAGYNLFANKNEVDVDLISAGGNMSLAIQANIKSIAETRKDCVGILNIPWGLSITDAVRYKNLLGSTTYSAIYCNGSKVLDAFTGSYVNLPPAIQVTPLIVKTDLIREPWYAVAGYNRGMLNEVVELEQNITDGEFETLYGAGINPCINDGSGPVVFGIKTMYVGSSAFNKLPIRRLMLKMEKDIKNSMKAFLFEPNTFDTRLRIVRTVEPYLDSIRARDGIEDYRVICDGTNNTNQTLTASQIIVDVYIKPIFSAEYIIFNFIVTKDEISSIISNT
jgi:phage tail sheath protein FI